MMGLTMVERWRRDRALDQIDVERSRQDNVWGEQNHPHGTGPDVWIFPTDHGLSGQLVSCSDEAAEVARKACKEAAEDGTVTWRHILLEEVFEAVAEEDVVKLREELVQAAAVAVAWIEAIDRNGE